ncbi:ATP-grasp domain-containing protein [Cohnella sp. CFH 77786]|uniref:ATP-grasp domain-containing protein n=1 Tax=Cohnella sp. CFH 77786 TaxID=2662265 RepID=UPI001C6081B2|nr:ATP-grasp domain-containing protein [Cohnella sp. CFH 77786]MBW5448462.1 ATP-grasp domain-containing protein [Cohnella sp. CFH 77786]
MYKDKRIMIVGGGEWQVPIIKKAKEMGLRVLNTNLYPESPGFEYADLTAIADVLDKDNQLRLAKQYQPHAIITDQSDIAVPTVAYLCEELGLPGIGVAVANQFTDKYLMREFIRSQNLPCPYYRLCSSEEEVLDFANTIGMPMILKPTNNQSSRGVNKISTFNEIPYLFRDTLQYSKEKQVLAESYVDGFELTVEGFQTNEGHRTLAVSKKKHLNESKTVARELLYTWSEPDINYPKLEAQHNLMVEMMGLPFGITHAEYKVVNDNYYLIEIAARGGGTKISSHIVPLLSGVDTNGMLIRMALGEQVKMNHSLLRNKNALLEFFVLPEGRVSKIVGVNKIRELPYLIDIGLSIKEGDEIRHPKDDRSRAGYFIIEGDDKEQLQYRASVIKNKLVVYYE